MTATFLRLGLLLGVPAACAMVHYQVATRTPNRATHFVAPTTQSAVTNPEVAKRASISLDEMVRVVAEQRVALLDARSPEEYAQGHIEGARSFHVDAVENDVTLITSQFDVMTEIVLYCGGGSCEDSKRLFDIMTQLLEYPNVRLFHGGLEAWEKAKLPIKKGSAP